MFSCSAGIALSVRKQVIWFPTSSTISQREDKNDCIRCELKRSTNLFSKANPSTLIATHVDSLDPTEKHIPASLVRRYQPEPSTKMCYSSGILGISLSKKLNILHDKYGKHYNKQIGSITLIVPHKYWTFHPTDLVTTISVVNLVKNFSFAIPLCNYHFLSSKQRSKPYCESISKILYSLLWFVLRYPHTAEVSCSHRWGFFHGLV